jgi:hypothetical protein
MQAKNAATRGVGIQLVPETPPEVDRLLLTQFRQVASPMNE